MARTHPLIVDSAGSGFAQILWDGVVAGLLGAFVVATVHLFSDAMAGQPFRTPTVLGTIFTDGAAAAANAAPSFETTLRFTFVHMLAWTALGAAGSGLISLVDARPRLAPVVFGSFAFVFVTALYASGALTLPGLPSLHLWAGTLLGSAAAAFYLVARHPRLADHIAREHLTETTRRELERALEHEAADLAAYHAIAERMPSPIFTKMIEEKRARSALLRARCEALGLPPSEDAETAHPWTASTLRAALEEALACERRTIDFYDRFLAAVPELPIRDLFLRLRYHVLDTTIPELERALEVER